MYFTTPTVDLIDIKLSISKQEAMELSRYLDHIQECQHWHRCTRFIASQIQDQVKEAIKNAS